MMDKKPLELQKVKQYIVFLLSRREYSKHEITEKCTARYQDDEGELLTIIDEMEAKDYISDVRFAESYVHWKHSQNYGEVRIKNEMQQKGVSSVLIEHEINQYDWYESAKALRLSRFGDSVAKDYKEKQKRMNYLLRRGFTFEQVKYAFD